MTVEVNVYAHPTPLVPSAVSSQPSGGRTSSSMCLTAAAPLALAALALAVASLAGSGGTDASLAMTTSLLLSSVAAACTLVGRALLLSEMDEVHHSLEQHTALLGRLGQPVAVIASGRVVFTNPAFSQWRDEQLGDRLDELLALAGGESRLPQSRGGAALWLDLRKVRVTWAGAPADLIQINDLTEARELQAQVAGKDRLAQVGLLAAGVAHEVNNPLMAVTTYLGLLREEVDGDAGLVEIVEELGSAISHIQDVANDLRMLGRPDGGDVEAIDPWQPILAASRLTRAQNGRMIDVQIDQTALAPVRGAHGKLVQVFLNLLINASHAVMESGVENPQIRVTAEQGRDAVVIRVQDNGSGVAEHIRDLIFEPEFSTRSISAGTGLGLWLCRRVLGEMDGKIDLEPNGEPGACFAVTLLRADAMDLTSDGYIDELPLNPLGWACEGGSDVPTLR